MTRLRLPVALRQIKTVCRAAIVFVAVCSLAFGANAQTGDAARIYQETFIPAKPGPVVLVLSGASGPDNYRDYAQKVASLGYYVVLLDGKDILTREQDGAANLLKAISMAQASGSAIPGKAAVIGFSQGGGGAILHAAQLPQQVSMVVAYYPAISWSPDMAWLASRIQVPLLVLAGARDKYIDCCLVESMHALETAAIARKAQFQLVVYPEANHGFSHDNFGTYRADDARNAWERTQAMLHRWHSIRTIEPALKPT